LKTVSGGSIPVRGGVGICDEVTESERCIVNSTTLVNERSIDLPGGLSIGNQASLKVNAIRASLNVFNDTVISGRFRGSFVIESEENVIGAGTRLDPGSDGKIVVK
jgi:hypothetical protein